MAKTDLVIVESPSKAKTIEKYLGAGYSVKASMGHVRDLPKSKLSVDVDNGFAPDYRPIKGKEGVIAELKKAAHAAGRVYLATDPDREGEAISWHLKELLELPENKVCRVTFNEITKQVVIQSIAAPRAIDEDLVNAQQARRILDRIVGYQISPLLWRVFRMNDLSAGRVQSVAVRMVVEREKEIRAFTPKEYWTLEARLGRRAPRTGSFTAQFFGKSKKIELHTEQEADAVLAAVSGKPFAVKSVKRQDKTRQPAPPFTTSTLQQDASRKLGMTPARTMSIAQQLYEGVDVAGVGTVGLITYMRTDSLRISAEAIAQAKSVILSRYGKDFYPEKTRYFRNRSGAQDAHEAIRPANVELSPEDVRSSLTGEQYRLYKLIWSRFLASQMANAIYDSVSIDVEGAENYIFRANHSAVKFSGFTAVYEEGRDEEEDAPQSPLPDLKEGEALAQEELSKAQHFTQPPARYTEATLIRALEEKGIGRPSTYAPTISTILSKEYVLRESKQLRATPLGETVDKVMGEEFPDIVDYAFTAQMEEKLDEVGTGKQDWRQLLSDFYGGFSDELASAKEALYGVKIEIPMGINCPKCGRELVLRSGKFGRFLGCPGFPECDFTMPMAVEMPGKCPKCGARILKRTGYSKEKKKQFTYYCCEFYKSKDEAHRCDFTQFDVPVKDNCPVCGQTMFKKPGKGAKKPYCINEQCANFTPEDKRGGWKKPAAKTAAAKTKTAAAKKSAPRKKAEKK